MCNTKRQSRYSAIRFYTALLLLHLAVIAKGQQHGVQWVLGDRESVLDFRNDTLINYPIGPIMPMFLTEANILDSLGNLLYYTNGIYVAGSDGNQIDNGDSLRPCQHTWDETCCGLEIPQGPLFLPIPGNDRYYYLFHMSNDTLNGGRPGILYYSVIDREANFNYGSVIQKNIIYAKDIFREGVYTILSLINEGHNGLGEVISKNNLYYVST